MFEKTLEFIDKASVEELQKEFEAYGIEFTENPGELLDVGEDIPLWCSKSQSIVDWHVSNYAKTLDEHKKDGKE